MIRPETRTAVRAGLAVHVLTLVGAAWSADTQPAWCAWERNDPVALAATGTALTPLTGPGPAALAATSIHPPETVVICFCMF